MSVLSREDLRAALAADPPLVEGLDLQVQPNGIDLRVDRVQRLTSPGLLGEADNVREPAAREDVPADKDGWWDLHRGAYVITYQEKVNLPTDIMALARPRSTLLRSGLARRGFRSSCPSCRMTRGSTDNTSSPLPRLARRSGWLSSP